MLHRHSNTAAARLPVSSDNNYSSTGLKKDIYLAAGCFWGAEHYFKQIRGVVATEAGYANGNIFHPTQTYGHPGYTGTASVIEPVSKTAVILLAHRVHPLDKGSVVRLRALVANVVAGAVVE